MSPTNKEIQITDKLIKKFIESDSDPLEFYQQSNVIRRLIKDLDRYDHVEFHPVQPIEDTKK